MRIECFYKAVAVDYDGTLTLRERPSLGVLEALITVRKRGLKIVLVTGRIMAELRLVFPEAETFFDLIVAENGAVLYWIHGSRLLAAPVDPVLAEALFERGVPVRRGEALLACSGVYDTVVLEEIRRLGLDCQLMHNRNELMVLPAGVTKGSGVVKGLAELGISCHSAVAIGDAENDRALLASCELGVAVGNAIDSLKASADMVLAENNGVGIVDFLSSDILCGKQRYLSGRWQLTLGHLDDDTPVTIPAAQINLLIIGASQSGKSYATGMILEQLNTMGYATLVLDMEGEYGNLERLPHVTTVGGGGLPSVDRLGDLVAHHRDSIVLDLSTQPRYAKVAYLHAAIEQTARQRSVLGYPHWIVVDEAHELLDGVDNAQIIFDPSTKGYCLITYRPECLCSNTLDNIDVVLTLGNGGTVTASIISTLARYTRLPHDVVTAQLKRLTVGQALLTAADQPGVTTAFTLAHRHFQHVRHQRKYVDVLLEPAHRFYFRQNWDKATDMVAANLTEFHQMLEECEDEVIAHHLRHHDFSRWVSETIQDAQMGEELFQIEQRLIGNVHKARLEIRAAIAARYFDG